VQSSVAFVPQDEALDFESELEAEDALGIGSAEDALGAGSAVDFVGSLLLLELAPTATIAISPRAMKRFFLYQGR
jgi:hypothetical protein